MTNVLADYKEAKCTVNDDAQIHKAGDAYWITATVAYEMTNKSGKVDMRNFRWTQSSKSRVESGSSSTSTYRYRCSKNQ